MYSAVLASLTANVHARYVTRGCLILLVLTVLAAPADASECLGSAVDLAYVEKDTAALARLADISQSEVTDQLRHRAAYAHYRSSLLALLADDERGAKKLAKAGLKITDKIRDPDADVLALMGSLYSVRIRTSAMSAIFLGKKSEKLIDQAVNLEPDNPRALLAKATATFFKPGTFGGGLDKALPYLERASKAFAGAPQDGQVCWGYADLLALQVRVAREQESDERVRTLLDELLAVHPAHPEVEALGAQR